MLHGTGVHRPAQEEQPSRRHAFVRSSFPFVDGKTAVSDHEVLRVSLQDSDSDSERCQSSRNGMSRPCFPAANGLSRPRFEALVIQRERRESQNGWILASRRSPACSGRRRLGRWRLAARRVIAFARTHRAGAVSHNAEYWIDGCRKLRRGGNGCVNLHRAAVVTATH